MSVHNSWDSATVVQQPQAQMAMINPTMIDINHIDSIGKDKKNNIKRMKSKLVANSKIHTS